MPSVMNNLSCMCVLIYFQSYSDMWYVFCVSLCVCVHLFFKIILYPRILGRMSKRHTENSVEQKFSLSGKSFETEVIYIHGL